MSDPLRDDAALILRCRQGDQDAIRELVENYQRAVYHVVWRSVGNVEDARDITQEAFIRAIRSLDRFDPARPFRNWIFRIATNLAIDHHRRARLRTVSIDIDENDEAGRRAPVLADKRTLPDEAYERSWLSERLVRLVDRLPHDYRVVVHLRHGEQLSYEEIADVLDAPLGTVKARLHRAHQRLRDLWGGGGASDPGDGSERGAEQEDGNR